VPDHFTLEDVERLALLARLELNEEEKRLFAQQLDDILTYVEQIREVTTGGIAPTSHPLGTAGSLRSDERRPSLPRGEVLTQAPDAPQDAGLFKVPRVMGS
jgi:aspartyl-tRNA(Asn)/glutamyl-tRNA(Gln) amidotransferase subunit C